jgi:hypothetical protein
MLLSDAGEGIASMNVQVMGQTLLGVLLLVALLVNIALLRLGRRSLSHFTQLAAPMRSLLLWLPWLALLLAGGGLALAESSLLTYHDAQDLSSLNWLVIGACLIILADVCAALVWITLREAIKATSSSDR